MKKPRYTLAMILDSVVEDLSQGSDHSTTTIRCAINDRLDMAFRDGYTVRAATHGYDQPRAVARVKNRLSHS